MIRVFVNLVKDPPVNLINHVNSPRRGDKVDKIDKVDPLTPQICANLRAAPPPYVKITHPSPPPPRSCS